MGRGTHQPCGIISLASHGGRDTNEALRKAFEAAARLSEADQESLAAAILAELEAEGAWDQAFLRSEAALGRLADEALDEYRARRTKPADPDRS